MAKSPLGFNGQCPKSKAVINQSNTLRYRMRNPIEFRNLADIFGGINDGAIQIASGGRYLSDYAQGRGVRRTKAELEGGG